MSVEDKEIKLYLCLINHQGIKMYAGSRGRLIPTINLDISTDEESLHVLASSAEKRISVDNAEYRTPIPRSFYPWPSLYATEL
jgi:hypothetical protein